MSERRELGVVEGGGTMFSEDEVTEVDIQLAVRSVADALPIIRRVLHASGAPAETAILEHSGPDPIEHKLIAE